MIISATHVLLCLFNERLRWEYLELVITGDGTSRQNITLID